METNRTRPRHRRRLVLTLAATAAALATGVGAAVAVPASAASSDAPSITSPAAHRTTTAVSAATAKATAAAAPYNKACGSGYTVIDSLPLSTLGTVYLTYNSANGNNCVVTVRTNPGSPVTMYAAIELSGAPGTQVSDYGDYTTYAGPVYIHAPNHCVDWAGQVDIEFNYQNQSHCASLTR